MGRTSKYCKRHLSNKHVTTCQTQVTAVRPVVFCSKNTQKMLETFFWGLPGSKTVSCNPDPYLHFWQKKTSSESLTAKSLNGNFAYKELQLIRGLWKLIFGSLNIYLVDNYEVNKSWFIMHLRYLQVYRLRKQQLFFFKGWMLEVQLPKLICFSKYVGFQGGVKNQKFQFTFWKALWLVCGSMNRRAEQCNRRAEQLLFS